MLTHLIEQAARNNAIWCDAVCKAHGIPGEFHKNLWLNRQPVPRFYSNVITLSSTDKVRQMARVQELIESPLPGTWSIKDSFSTLPLAELGFQVLFEAVWIWRVPLEVQIPLDIGIRWSVVKDPAELKRWEFAWGDELGNISAIPQQRIFLPSLLEDPDIALLAACQGEEIVGGAIANRTGDVVGISNVFACTGERHRIWTGGIRTIQGLYPGLPLVGYQRGEDLALMEELDFEQVGNLRVWIRQ